MVTGKYAAPLSPPNSPRMSDATAKTHDYYHQNAAPASHYTTSTAAQHGQTQYEAAHPYSYDEPRPPLRSYKSFSHPTGRWPYESSDQSTASNAHDQRLSHGAQQAAAHQSNPGDSGATSPADRLTPRSPSNSKEHHDDDDLIDYGGDDQDDDAEKPPMTAEEIRRQKRKMKRFRFVKSSNGIGGLGSSANFSQTHSQSNTIPHERVRTASASRCGSQREAGARDSGSQCAASPGVVPEPVRCNCCRNDLGS